MSKRHIDTEDKENESEQVTSTNSDLVDINEIRPLKKTKITHSDVIPQVETLSSDRLNDDNDTKGPWSIGSIIQNNDGQIHPTNKQYFIYENARPNMISKTARFWSRKYLKVLQHVDPDTYNIYIHNDFVCYGELEIIENCLMDMVKGIFLKYKNRMSSFNHVFAFRRLEALTVLLNSTNSFIGIDDGIRFNQIIRVIGACYVTILRGLLPESMFTEEKPTDDDMKKLNKILQQLPNFRQVIREALIVGHVILSAGDIRSAYTNILQTIYHKWSTGMDRITINLNTKPSENDKELWAALKHANERKKTAFQESFNFLKEFQHYAKINPDIGGNSHDLRTWSKTQRNMYSFQNDDKNNDDSYWSRL